MTGKNEGALYLRRVIKGRIKKFGLARPSSENFETKCFQLTENVFTYSSNSTFTSVSYTKMHFCNVCRRSNLTAKRAYSGYVHMNLGQ